jgi:4-alpha-glucanotransferase
VQLSVRSSGILLPVASLPHAPFCGDLGQGARQFIDFLYHSGQTWWQMLPINPIDRYNSPYASISAFAGEPLYIDLEHLVQQGLLDHDDTAPQTGPLEKIAYSAARDYRNLRLRKAFDRYRRNLGGDIFRQNSDRFREENSFWLDAHSVFCALADRFGTQEWPEWSDVHLRRHNEEAINAARNVLREDMEYHLFLQLVFDVQWGLLREYCRQRGIGMIGDVPIYVAAASADTWENRHLFQLDEDGNLLRSAGVPGDSFNPDGQRWNSPLYQWGEHESQHYQWWLNRMKLTLQRFDAVRLDHFIGFENYFSLPQTASEEDRGHWYPGPGAHFFEAVLKSFPNARLIAEDLGVLSEGVVNLRDKFAFPGMNVLQFHFDYRHDGDPTRHWQKNSIVCTGTHDTNTIMGWIHDIRHASELGQSPWDRDYLTHLVQSYIPHHLLYENKEISPDDVMASLEHLNASMVSADGSPVPAREQIHTALLRMVMSSPGDVAIFPMQDILGLGSEARMNFPGTSEGNWLWRLDISHLTEKLAASLKSFVVEYHRNPPAQEPIPH